jgi:hypothetical protein
MPNTFVKLATATVGAGGASTIDLTSIPSGYTDLCLKVSMRTNRADTADPVLVTFNGVTTGYRENRFWADGSSVSAYGSTQIEAQYANSTNSSANNFASLDMYITNYASTSQYKSFNYACTVQQTSNPMYTVYLDGIWSNTAAINRITLDPIYGSNMVQYSTATLYGIKKH